MVNFDFSLSMGKVINPLNSEATLQKGDAQFELEKNEALTADCKEVIERATTFIQSNNIDLAEWLHALN